MKYLKYFETSIHRYDYAWQVLPQEQKDMFKFKIGDIVKMSDSSDQISTSLFKINSLIVDKINQGTKNERIIAAYGVNELDNKNGSQWRVSADFIELATDADLDVRKYNL